MKVVETVEDFVKKQELKVRQRVRNRAVANAETSLMIFATTSPPTKGTAAPNSTCNTTATATTTIPNSRTSFSHDLATFRYSIISP